MIGVHGCYVVGWAGRLVGNEKKRVMGRAEFFSRRLGWDGMGLGAELIIQPRQGCSIFGGRRKDIGHCIFMEGGTLLVESTRMENWDARKGCSCY